MRRISDETATLPPPLLLFVILLYITYILTLPSCRFEPIIRIPGAAQVVTKYNTQWRVVQV